MKSEGASRSSRRLRIADAPQADELSVPTVALAINPATLAPLVRQIVAETVAAVQEAQVVVPTNGPLAFSEEQAAAMLGVEIHVLADERRRGRITASRIVGRRIRYTRETLLNYLAERQDNVGRPPAQ
jgi:helix-turn-helix protein